MTAARSWGCPTTTTTNTAHACLAASKSGCKTACGGGCGGIMTARMGCSVSSPTNVCSDNINAGRFLGRAPGADSFATYIPGKPDAGNPPVRFDEGREPADSPRAAHAYPTLPLFVIPTYDSKAMSSPRPVRAYSALRRSTASRSHGRAPALGKTQDGVSAAGRACRRTQR
jgi:hypothetical protein